MTHGAGASGNGPSRGSGVLGGGTTKGDLPAGLAVLDGAGRVVFMDTDLALLLGHEVTDLVGHDIFRFVEEHQRPAARQALRRAGRTGRVGPAVADWIIERARARGDFEVVVTDLAELNLPMFDEPNHPRLHQYVHQHTKDWSAIVEASDAFVFVIPEYNYGFNAATKNAIDYLNSEWLNKPAGIVSYGGVAAGTRATQMLKQVLSALKVVVVTDSVNIPFVREKLDEDGRLKPNEIMEQAAAVMLDELARWAQALRPLRSAATTP